MDDPEPPERFPAPIKTSLALIHEWLDRITAAATPSPDTALRELRAALIHLLDIIEPDPNIDVAVDELSAAVSAYLDEVARAAVMQTEVGDAVARQLTTLQVSWTALRTSLADAQPRTDVLW